MSQPQHQDAGTPGPAATPAPVASPAPPQDPECDALRDAGLGPAAFQRAVLAGLGQQAGLRVASLGPFRIHVTHGATSAEVHLDAAYKRYRHQTAEVADAVEEIKAALGVPGAAVAAAGPFPRLTRANQLAAGVFAQPCPFDPELAVFYVRALPSGHVPVGAQEVGDPSALAADAVAALRALTQRQPADATGEGPALVLRYTLGDGLDAARALLPDLVAAWAEWVTGQLYLALPTRDLLLGVGDGDPAVLAAARAEAAERYRQDPHPLARRWYTAGADGALALADLPALDATSPDR